MAMDYCGDSTHYRPRPDRTPADSRWAIPVSLARTRIQGFCWARDGGCNFELAGAPQFSYAR
eukprot:15454077-Alexandrium_andersonii.AAC.1